MGTEFKSLLCAVALACMAAPAAAHGDAPAAKAAKAPASEAEQTRFGIAGDPKQVARTVKVDMTDAMRFAPSLIEVRRGDTVRFIVANNGRTMHEMVIGTAAELKEHAALMKKFPTMEHEAPYMAHVAPGASGSIVWRFNRAGEFAFACLVAGHSEAGMVGTIVVK